MISRLLQRRREPPFRPLERKLVETLAAALPPEAGAVLTRQVRLVNRVQRHANDREVNLYQMRRGKASSDGMPMFPLALPEVKLASVAYALVGKSQAHRVDFWLVEGRFFSLAFQQSPKGVDADQVEIRDVRLLVDPMIPVQAVERRPLDAKALKGWVAEWVKQWEVTGLREPLPRSEFEHALQQIEATLPTDYLDLMVQTEGLQMDGCRVYGVSEVRDVAMPDATYYVLAEMEDRGVLAVRQGSPECEVYFFAYDQNGVAAGPSLRQAVEKLLRGELA